MTPLNTDKPFKISDLEPIEDKSITLKPEPMTHERMMLLRTHPKYREGAVRECIEEINWLLDRVHALAAENERLRKRNPMQDTFVTTKGTK